MMRIRSKEEAKTTLTLIKESTEQRRIKMETMFKRSENLLHPFNMLLLRSNLLTQTLMLLKEREFNSPTTTFHSQWISTMRLQGKRMFVFFDLTLK